ncbi:hypothetical protein PDE_01273 [Penicillium oxalicum 114-2]|uniref:FAD dependent oxidoreductase domain-containing protein n=1 Tax=Penicillium oxalicum (strain 114-2 / CGMCC 5302) TaxID=933388 RepID=S8AWU4_PENO1|nr:hypothetical protein PDE_01273 [Penicillium oxalicum 114-2]
MPPVTTPDNPEEFARLRTTDPGLPRPNPTPAYWQHIPHPLANARSERLPSQRDYAIIGSGITGLSVARTLLESHPSVTVSVLEARSLCSGATGRNGGQMAINAGEEYSHLAEAFGPKMAGEIAMFTLRNLRGMQVLAEEYDAVETSEVQQLTKLRIFMINDKLEAFKQSIARFEADHPALKGMYTLIDASTLRKEHGIHEASGGALLPAGTVWPYRLVTKVFETLLKRFPDRLTVETNTPVTAIEMHDSSAAANSAHAYSVQTPRGSMTVGTVVYCTNGYSGHLLPALRGLIYPFKGTMTVQDPGTSMPNRGAALSWGFHYPPAYDPATKRQMYGLYYLGQSATTGYFYFGGENKRIDDAVSADDSFVATSSVDHLQSVLPRFFGKEEVHSSWNLVGSWSGIMGFTTDGLPLVGRLSSALTGRRGEGEWIAAGFNGYGMANCLLCGEALGRMMLGHPTPEWLPGAYQVSEERLAKSASLSETKKTDSRL